MQAAEYDAWYDTPRGRWIGETEFLLLHRLLEPRSSESLLDAGCGTGWFTLQWRWHAKPCGSEFEPMEPR